MKLMVSIYNEDIGDFILICEYYTFPIVIKIFCLSVANIQLFIQGLPVVRLVQYSTFELL